MHSSARSSMMRGLAAAAFFTAAQLACAHAQPVHAVPAQGAAVVAPNAVTIDFDDALERAFSSIEVTDAAGRSVTLGKSTLAGTNKKRMSVALGTLEPGAYRVKWVAVAVDGHRTQGSYSFSVKK